jgi:hypothetical protein
MDDDDMDHVNHDLDDNDDVKGQSNGTVAVAHLGNDPNAAALAALAGVVPKASRMGGMVPKASGILPSAMLTPGDGKLSLLILTIWV